MRGLLEIPVKLDKPEIDHQAVSLLYLTFGVWVMIETSDFFRIMEKWKDPESFTVNGHLNNSIPSFEDSLGVSVTVTTRSGGLRPIVALKDDKSTPLLLASQQGFSLLQLESLYESLFHKG